jgi:putative FmdB family regulatory protein
MPIYEYECENCGRIEETLQKISDAPLCRCRHCSGNLHKLVSPSSFHLKGTGWYVTDYAKKSAKKTEGSSPPESKETVDSKCNTDTGSDKAGKKSTPE